MCCVTKLIDNRGNDSQLICAGVRVDNYLTEIISVRDRSHWPWLPTACPGLMEIAEDVFESFKDHENEIPVVVLVGIRVGFAIRAFVSFRRWPRT